jgi:hypothetical protein
MVPTLSLSKWLSLPSRIALLLGLGALSATGASASAPETAADPPNSSTSEKDPPNFADLVIRSEGGRIYLAEGGGPFKALGLGDTAEAQLLKEIVERQGATPTAIRVKATILAGAGGDGFHWAPVTRPDVQGKSGSSGKPVPAQKTFAPNPSQRQPQNGLPHNTGLQQGHEKG